MGVSVVGKAWRLGVLSTNLALLSNNNNKKQQQQQHVCSRKNNMTISWSLVCGLMLFVLGLISLLTGHMLSDLEWYSHRLVHPTFYSRLVINLIHSLLILLFLFLFVFNYKFVIFLFFVGWALPCTN